MTERTNRRARRALTMAPALAGLALALAAGATAAQEAPPSVEDIAAAVRARVGDAGISVGAGTTGAVTIGTGETQPVDTGGLVAAEGGTSVATGDTLGSSDGTGAYAAGE